MRTARLLTVSQRALQGVVPARGLYLPGGVPTWGVPAQGRYLPRYSHLCEQNDRQVQKYYLAPNFVCGR